MYDAEDMRSGTKRVAGSAHAPSGVTAMYATVDGGKTHFPKYEENSTYGDDDIINFKQKSDS